MNTKSVPSGEVSSPPPPRYGCKILHDRCNYSKHLDTQKRGKRKIDYKYDHHQLAFWRFINFLLHIWFRFISECMSERVIRVHMNIILSSPLNLPQNLCISCIIVFSVRLFICNPINHFQINFLCRIKLSVQKHRERKK